MAEFIAKKYISDFALEKQISVDSAATSTEEIGNDMYPPAKSILREKGIPFTRRAARQIRQSDYDYYDYLVGMDRYNIQNMVRFFREDPEHKILMLLDRPVADPWYTGDFESTYNDLCEGIPPLINNILKGQNY